MTVVPSWIEAHAVIPDGFRAGQPFRLYDAQLLYIASMYTVRPDVIWVPENPVLAAAFLRRRGLIVAPQKWGKNPLGAVQVLAEGCGPVVFAGFAGRDDGYACDDWGCGCGWEYRYDPGEPMGMLWPTPIIQITAFSEKQTDNTWKLLRPMIAKGPLVDVLPNRGEDKIRLRHDDDLDEPAVIETVTASSLSRLGARATFILQDQLESWLPTNGMDDVADAQYRNLAGTGGRASLLANAWDPSQASIAKREWELVDDGIYRQAIWPPTHAELPCLDADHDHYGDPLERRRIFETVYPLDHRREGGGHVDLDNIDAEAEGILQNDPPQAKRWFGNELVEGSGKAFEVATFTDRRRSSPYLPPDKSLIVVGVDGSVLWDHFPLIATEVVSGYQWPLHIWTPNGVEVDVTEVDDVVAATFDRWEVWRLYGDPPYIESWLSKWAGQYGEKRVIAWDTSRVKAMAYALRSWKQAMNTGEMSHCDATWPWCALFTQHVANAHRRDTGYQDDVGPLWTVQKERKGSQKKIDSVPAGALSWAARLDAIASGALNVEVEESAYDGLTEEEIVARMRV
jgi:hypothetical protein